jgi:hypothetical protein
MLTFATLDEETASACFYTLPRGGKTIQGPSIRMAEIAVACYGNLRAGVRCIETETHGEAPHAVLQSVAHDLEKNVAITIEKRRRIVGKKSKGGHIDEDDINLAVNAGSAIAFRDAVFKIVPQALIKPVWLAAKKVAVGDVKSLAAKRGQVVDRLKQMGVTEDRILAVVNKAKVEDIGVEEVALLIGLGTALKDGETTLEAAFPPILKEADGAPTSRVAQMVSKLQGADGGTVAAAPASKPEPADAPPVQPPKPSSVAPMDETEGFPVHVAATGKVKGDYVLTDSEGNKWRLVNRDLAVVASDFVDKDVTLVCAKGDQDKIVIDILS